jgi:hypothetical protein
MLPGGCWRDWEELVTLARISDTGTGGQVKS